MVDFLISVNSNSTLVEALGTPGLIFAGFAPQTRFDKLAKGLRTAFQLVQPVDTAGGGYPLRRLGLPVGQIPAGNDFSTRHGGAGQAGANAAEGDPVIFGQIG